MVLWTLRIICNRVAFHRRGSMFAFGLDGWILGVFLLVICVMQAQEKIYLAMYELVITEIIICGVSL